MSPENFKRYVKDLEELWKKGADPRWEDRKGGIENTSLGEIPKQSLGYRAGALYGEGSRKVAGHRSALCENVPGRFRAGEWNAFISLCVEEVCLDIGDKAG